MAIQWVPSAGMLHDKSHRLRLCLEFRVGFESLYSEICGYLWFFLWFFKRYFLYLHFKCYPLSLFPLWKPPIPSTLLLLNNPPTPSSLSWHFPTLGHWAFTGPKESPPIDAQQGHPLLHMWLESWVPPCVLFGGLVPGNSGGNGCLILLFLLWGWKSLQLLWFFL